MSNDGRSQATVRSPLSGPYAGLRAVLATMHGKEAAIVPAFKEQLELAVEIPSAIDTDTLGTFTGEIARAGTIREAALAKARLGMAATGLSIGIASEGSYGPHPHVPFIPGGVELMVLVDDERGIVVSEHLIDHAPVYEHAVAVKIGDLRAFLDHIRFPDHAVIVRPHEPDDDDVLIYKGLRTDEALESALATTAPRSRDGRALVQTDMRAHMNPTRMASIARLAHALCDRLATPCPACDAPGYGQIDVETGLPCEWCGAPSIMVRHHIFGCAACEFREERPRPDGRTHADPGHCPECNP
ncbi:MAG: DUF6671 family protein [Pseudomonadota bacterium]